MSPLEAREALQKAEANRQLEEWRKTEIKDPVPVEPAKPGVQPMQVETKVAEFKQVPPVAPAPQAPGAAAVDPFVPNKLNVILFRAGDLTTRNILVE